jgi:lipoprotein-releasing system ATP-binding protein
MTEIIKAQNIHKRYDGGEGEVEVLRGVDFSLNEREAVGIYGASGAGKSTLLHILGSIDMPTEGTVKLFGNDVALLGDVQKASLRNTNLGFVFQFYHLLPEFTALENVMIPCMIAGRPTKEAKLRASEALDRMGLSHRANHRPAEMSGGEQQRTAIARAAVLRPKLILADEPTGNLDRQTGNKVWEYLLRLAQDEAMAMVVVSHNHDLLGDMPQVHELKDGAIARA